MNESWMQVLAIIGSNLVIMLTIFGVSVSLHNGIREEIRDFHNEMRNIHGRVSVVEEKTKDK